MSIIGIRAHFPLGVYVGHRPDGSPDLLPSTLRLHSALVAAASAGSSAEVKPSGLTRTRAATRALEWIEDNPPEFVELPTARESRQEYEASWRDEGVFNRVRPVPKRRKVQRAVGFGTAVSAPIGWGWDSVPEDIAESLRILCEDVPCLGEADSPVVLEFGPIAPTHRRSQQVSPFARVATRIATPISGRLGELDELHRAAQLSKTPTIAQDRWKESELPDPPLITHSNSVDIGYDMIDKPTPPPAPWRHVIHVGIDGPISNLERVAWSVAVHRAMVAALDTDTSAIITGRYDREAVPPANRVAVQPIDAGVMSLSQHSGLGQGIAVLVPEGALAITSRALDRVQSLYRRGSKSITLRSRSILEAATFWRAPEPGMVRVWESLPAVMPETRRPRRSAGRAWTLAESALLSVGFVFRDALPMPPSASAQERYDAIVKAVSSRGVTALTTVPMPDADIGKYAHKMPQGVVAQPYRLQLDGGSLIPAQALIAVGQSRHLGGGLLCPLDRPASLVESWSVAR
ncbi:type I-U CRISPR-associated protein Cas5/Cas6 [Mycolicibacter longobardus]|nr:type I-U CRISPR-associated protein Csb2 [Mycolicibacter longobardus]MCV7383975.1 type I-U CRISPR-associated protein Cas5/Cas6 [Mycolicibacter longobardus]